MVRRRNMWRRDKTSGRHRSRRRGATHALLAVFLFFLFFYFCFLQKYIFDLEIYRNIPRPPRCRVAGTWPPGSGAAGAFLKKIRGENCAQVPEDRSPGSGTAGPLGRPAAGPPDLPPLYKGWLVPPPLICITKLLETKKMVSRLENPAGLRLSPSLSLFSLFLEL